MKYFSLLTNQTKAANKLQEEIWQSMEDNSNKLTDDVELSIVQIRNSIMDMNDKYSRTQPVRLIELRNNNLITLSLCLDNDQRSRLTFCFHLVKK